MSSIQDEFEPLLQAAKDYEQSVESKVSKSKARTLLKKVQEYAELPPNALRVPVLVDFFGLCYKHARSCDTLLLLYVTALSLIEISNVKLAELESLWRYVT